MGKYIMAMDQGTTSSRCILFDKAGNICSSAQKEFAQYYPKPGWVEHDPHEIWSSQMAVAIEAMERSGLMRGILQPLELQISVRQQLSGTKKQEILFIRLLYGSAAVRQT